MRRLPLVLGSVLLTGASALAGTLAEGPAPERAVPELPAAAPALVHSFSAAGAPVLSSVLDAQAVPAAPALRGPELEPSASSPRAQAPLSLAEPAFAFDGARHGWARVSLLAQRAAVLPAHAWPFTVLAKAISHGEGLAGLTPSGAVAAARGIKDERGAGSVIGRLSWELHDAWSVRGAARSYARLIDRLAAAKKRDPGLDAAVSLDVEALGAQLDGLSEAERARIARAYVLSLARRAHAAGIPIELDIGASAQMPLLLAVARSAVLELGRPVRLALAARYLASEEALSRWARLARETGLRLGVRLVKGSFIEGDRPGTLYTRGALLTQYKRLITLALSEGPALDVAVATHNEEIWAHARAESARLGAPVSFQTIRGVNASVQDKMRAAGDVPREYVSYGVDTPVMAVMEWWTNWRQKRALQRRGADGID